MRKRTLARELALQVLYQMDITRQDPPTALQHFWLMTEFKEVEDEVRKFTEELVLGVTEHLEPIDAKIAEYATNWELSRMAVVDRNVLRLGSCELLFRTDIPPKVSINEAVELAKKFSGVQAGKFVNGILDKIKGNRSA
ncbi:MAG TPA: transcription antitermination factor NusB [Candidatus Omnitrophota bacterium]|nr:transcription antitermination factor NusB [Candidatus Omnitrophota bacterium]HRZ14455.1 transcription antitermination factor NusB [Candidatus Omnitrophota bacterium]